MVPTQTEIHSSEAGLSEPYCLIQQEDLGGGVCVYVFVCVLGWEEGELYSLGPGATDLAIVCLGS